MRLKPSIWFVLFLVIVIIWLLTVCRVLGGQTSPFVSNAKPMAKAVAVDTTLPTMPAVEEVYEEPAPPTIMRTFGWGDTNTVGSVIGYLFLWGTNQMHNYTTSNRTSTTNITLEQPFGDNPPRIFAAVLAIGLNGLISAPSAELRIPEFPPNRVVLSWATNSASIQHSTDLRSWSTATNFSGTSLDMSLMPGPHFYRATQTLGIRAYFKEP